MENSSVLSEKNTKKTTSSLVIIFGMILAIIIFSGLAWIAYGKEKNTYEHVFRNIAKFIQTPPKAKEKVVSITPEPKEVIVSQAPTNEPTQYLPRKTVYYPTLTPVPPLPTIEPGAPGSKEWNEAFWRKWDEMGKNNAEMQRKVEASQKQFCQDHPTLCR